VATSFEPTFAVVEDFEERSVTVSGGVTADTVVSADAMLTATNGLNTLEISDPGAGDAVTFTSSLNGADTDRFTFNIRPDASTDFNLTLTFTEDTGSGSASYNYVLPVEAGDEWIQIGIGFSQIGDGFNPASTAAGGTGLLQSVSLSADANVTYAVDDMVLASGNTPVVEVNDFESTNLAYGPPFCPPTFDTSSDVATNGGGAVARTIQGGGCFGYNYQVEGGGPALFPAVTSSSAVTFLARGSEQDSVQVFIQTANGNEGGFGESVTVAVPVGAWGEVRVPLSSLGDTPEAIRTAGITNVGFTSAGVDPDFAIDDIKIESE